MTQKDDSEQESGTWYSAQS